MARSTKLRTSTEKEKEQEKLENYKNNKKQENQHQQKQQQQQQQHEQNMNKHKNLRKKIEHNRNKNSSPTPPTPPTPPQDHTMQTKRIHTQDKTLPHFLMHATTPHHTTPHHTTSHHVTPHHTCITRSPHYSIIFFPTNSSSIPPSLPPCFPHVPTHAATQPTHPSTYTPTYTPKEVFFIHYNNPRPPCPPSLTWRHAHLHVRVPSPHQQPHVRCSSLIHQTQSNTNGVLHHPSLFPHPVLCFYDPTLGQEYTKRLKVQEKTKGENEAKNEG